ncbi:MAG: toll/interleukin-1 receptor domain-containing protein [Bacteroidales bacterium]|nr:toll/interleukin-1 receptor domain-containing protein [Bacteroidales bacterium]
MNDTFKYFAFISYNAKDTAWGKRLQKKLEHYKMPAALCSEHGWKRKPIRPVFFAPTDIQPGGLSNELQERLKAAQHLIVICSPNSAKSTWVGKEIEFFHSLGRANNIHFFIVDGIPHSGNPETECFNPVIDKLGLPEILGANIHEKIYRWPWLNKERAYVQLISKLLGVEFDAIWQRHKRQLIRHSLLWAAGGLLVLTTLIGVGKANRPFDSEIRLDEATIQNTQLPPMRNAVVTLSLDNETKTDTISSMDAATVFSNIPHRFLSKPVHVNVACPDFLDTDTTLVLTRQTVLSLRRDPSVYGDIHFRLWDITNEEAVAMAMVEIEGQQTQSDENGLVTLSLPLEKQRKAYRIKTELNLVNDSIFMPCGEDDVILVEE